MEFTPTDYRAYDQKCYTFASGSIISVLLQHFHAGSEHTFIPAGCSVSVLYTRLYAWLGIPMT